MALYKFTGSWWCEKTDKNIQNAVVGTPKDEKHNINSKKVTMRRDLPTSNKAALCRYLMQINWPLLFTPLVSCEEK